MGKTRRYLLELFPTRLWMRSAWEKRARRNADHYVADFREDWSECSDAYFASGAMDVERVLGVTEWGSTSEARLLEIGCGNGRMTRHLCNRFGHVVGIDISPSMIQRAKTLNKDLRNAEFRVSSGVNLGDFANESFDFVISYLVFQHIPRKTVINKYVDEALRVLKPGGRLRFQARNDALYSMPDTYTGATIELQEIQDLAQRHGRKILSVTGEKSFYCFVEIG